MNNVKKDIGFFLLLAIIVHGFSSCASAARPRETRPYVWLTENARFVLLPTKNIETLMDNQQLISAYFGGQNHRLIAWVKADDEVIDMTFISELGATVGELSYRDGVVRFSSPVLPRAFGGEFIVADFQLAFYCAAALRDAMESIGLRFEEVVGEAGNSRRVFDGETLIVEIERSRSLVRLVNHLRGYSMTFEGDFE